jgi:hypothetical protein
VVRRGVVDVAGDPHHPDDAMALGLDLGFFHAAIVAWTADRRDRLSTAPREPTVSLK